MPFARVGSEAAPWVLSTKRKLLVTAARRRRVGGESTVGRMRILAGLVPVIFLLALLPPAAVLADNEIVLDDESPAVQMTGVWATTAATSGFVGSGYHFRVAGDGSSTVVWPFNGPSASYEVFARWTSGPNRASNATYVVIWQRWSGSVSVDQRTGGGAWHSLGTFRFAREPVKASPCPTMPTASSLPTRFAGCRPDQPRLRPPAAPAAMSSDAAAGDPRFFDETQFRVDRDAFWDFFQKRGGVRTFGYPVSRDFPFLGCQTQFFQRVAMQQCGDAGRRARSTCSTTACCPTPTSTAAPCPRRTRPDRGGAAAESIRTTAARPSTSCAPTRPIRFDGEPVNFSRRSTTTVSLADAFPQGDGDAGLLPLLNLQLWGLPTSKPAYDPNNHDFIYQRFQRGVMHYDRGCSCTQGLLLADYLKGLLTGERLPDDLAAQAAGSPLLRARAAAPATCHARPRSATRLQLASTAAVAAAPVHQHQPLRRRRRSADVAGR